MSLKRLALAAALALGLGGAAQAAETASPDAIAAAAHIDYAKKGGQHGWSHHNRGRHLGWYKHHRRYGYHHPYRYGYYRPYRVYRYGYAPAYRHRGPYATGSTRAVGGMHHPGKHKGWSKHGW